MSDSFLKLCNLAKIEIDTVIDSINLDQKTGSDFLSQKNAASPVVTKIDLEIEKQLRKLIEIQYPDAGILGEEYLEKLANKESKYRFILDPIDGTIALVTGNLHTPLSWPLKSLENFIVDGYIFLLLNRNIRLLKIVVPTDQRDS